MFGYILPPSLQRRTKSFVVERGGLLFSNYRDYQVNFDLFSGNCADLICSGKVLPLTKASRLGDYIVGSAVEAIETEELVRQAAEDIANDFYDKSKPLETLINEVHDKFKTKGVKLQKLGGHDEYNVSSIGKSNINTWKKSAKISDGKGSITSVSISMLLSQGGVCWTTSFIQRLAGQVCGFLPHL